MSLVLQVLHKLSYIYSFSIFFLFFFKKESFNATVIYKCWNCNILDVALGVALDVALDQNRPFSATPEL